MESIRIWSTACAVLVFGCGAGQSSTATRPCASSDAVVAASDYTSSAIIPVAPDGKAVTPIAGPDLGKDPALAASGGRRFWVARDIGFVFELDACGQPMSRVLANDPSHPGTANPQDVAVAGDTTLWVPRFNVPTLLVLNHDGTPHTTVDLSSYDIDGNPQMNAAAVVAPPGDTSKVFVSLERLDDAHQLASTRPSELLRIDAASATVEATLELAGRNPFGLMAQGAAGLYLAEPGSFDSVNEPDAGIELVDPATFTSKLLVHEEALGASVTEVAVTDRCGAAIVADATPSVNVTYLVTFDPDSGAVFRSVSSSVLSTPVGYKLEGLAWKGGTLLVGDRSATAAGYTVHTLLRSGACDLAETSPLYVPQMPVAVRTAM